MTTFTASEVRELAVTMGAMNLPTTRDMLRAYADRLEVDEKAVPVAITCDGYDGDRTGCIKSDKPLPLGTNLYTHPAPADAERLAEALRQAMQSLRTIERGAMREKGLEDAENVRAYARSRAGVAESVLSAHPVQAQPPAASVTDEMVERARSAFVQADDGSTGITDAIRAALLAAQESPNG